MPILLKVDQATQSNSKQGLVSSEEAISLLKRWPLSGNYQQEEEITSQLRRDFGPFPFSEGCQG